MTVPRHGAYRPDVDGLRAVAVGLVVVFHAFAHVLPGGFVGVDVFFVISGYLITGIVLDDRERGQFSLRRFYARRVRRIFPALVVVLAATFALGWWLLTPNGFAQLGQHIAAGAGFVPNFVFWDEFGYFDTAAETKPLLHLWSLGIEEQFYVVWPMALVLLARWRGALLALIGLLAAASLVANVVVVRTDPTAAFYAPWTRAWELLCGAVLAVAARRTWWGLPRRSGAAFLSVAGFVAVVAAAVVLDDTTPFPGWWATLPVLGTSAMIAAGPDAPVNRLLAVRPLVAVGLVSYPLYLWHWPLLTFAAIDAGGRATATARLGAVLVAAGLAVLTFLLLERPVRRRRDVRWHVPALAAGVVSLGALGLVTAQSEGFSGRFEKTIRDVLAYADYDPLDGLELGRGTVCWVGDEESFDDFPAGCHLSPGGDGVLLWGDSHAGRLYPGLRTTLDAGVPIGEFSKSSCPPVVGYETPVHGPLDRCPESNDEVLAEIRRTPPDAVVMFAVWGNYVDDWSASSDAGRRLGETVRAVVDAGVPTVIVMGPAPKWNPDLPTVMAEDWERQSPPRRLTERIGGEALDPVPAVVDAQLRAVVEGAGATYLSLIGALCDARGCLTSVPGEPGRLLTWDYGHLTTDGGIVVSRLLIDRLGAG